MAATDAMLLGRVTYQTFAAAFSGGTDPMATRMNETPKYVVSTSLESADWQNSTLVRGDVVAEVTKLKQQPGRDIGMSGSATLVRSLLRHGLLDELVLWMTPVVVGGGRRLFADGEEQVALRLVDSKAFSTGMLRLTYAPA